MIPTPTTTPAVHFGDVTPILRVANVAASVAFYTERLGFAVRWHEPGFVSIARGDAALFLCEGDQGRAGTWVYVGVSDADALHDELCARGVAIRVPPTNYPWGVREMHVADPDGHALRFGSDATDEPVGDWVDGAGVRWALSEKGEWRAASPSPASDDIAVYESELREAMLQNDVAALDRLIDDDLMFTAIDGSIATKQDDLAAHRARRLRLERMETRDLQVRRHERTVITNVLVEFAGTWDGAPVGGQLRYTRVWVERKGRYRIVAGHVSAVP